MITQKFFVSFSFKKKWYKKRNSQSCVFSFEKGRLDDKSPYQVYNEFNHELHSRYGWNKLKLENISYLGEFKI